MPRIRTHPGEVLREDYLKPLGLSARALAAALYVPSNRISEIVRERRDVTADTAWRLARYFGTTPEFWLNLQMQFDLGRASGREIERIVALATKGRAAGNQEKVSKSLAAVRQRS
jgi:antitoxin HigA-1